MTLAPGTKLGPYEILSPIGAGGMGEVWKARDTRLGRIVAIKKVKEQHNERFKQEARSIAALNHPNICQIHDIGEDYLILEYVEGKPLSTPLPEKEAVGLAIQIATALEAAHKKGIIHRDLKPSNIMVTEEGSVKLLDFGLAKLYEQRASESTAEFAATQAGAVLGTVAYMSPEQAQGQPADTRSDIFSFGLVLYEMLSGRKAFYGNTPLAIGSALMKEDPPPLHASPSLENIVHRCLLKQPSARYQTISDVKTSLEQVLKQIERMSSEDPQPSIAVLPFVNMSGDKEQEYFSDGLAEEIINALTQIPGLRVTARTSGFAFRGKEQDIRKIADALNVRTILEGSVRKAGNRIRVTAQLVSAADGYHLWSERYDRDMTDVFAIQDEISQAIAEKLRVRLSGDRPLIKHHTENVEAYNLYLKGRYQLLKFTPESMARSREYYEQAIRLDPNYAPAWSGLADFYHRMGFRGLTDPHTAHLQSKEAVMKALGLDESLPEAHSILAVLHADEFDWTGAEGEFLRALELDPKSEESIAYYGFFCLLPMGRLDEAIDVVKGALELNPLAPFLQFHIGFYYFLTKQHDRAVEHAHNALELDPHFYQAHMLLGMSFTETLQYDEAIRAFEMAIRLGGERAPIGLANLGWAYAKAGRIEEARALLTELRDISKTRYIPPCCLAWIHLGLGEIDLCLDWLHKAAEVHDNILFLMLPIHNSRAEPSDPLRSHPRYQALLRKMNLEA